MHEYKDEDIFIHFYLNINITDKMCSFEKYHSYERYVSKTVFYKI